MRQDIINKRAVEKAMAFKSYPKAAKTVEVGPIKAGQSKESCIRKVQ